MWRVRIPLKLALKKHIVNYHANKIIVNLQTSMSKRKKRNLHLPLCFTDCKKKKVNEIKYSKHIQIRKTNVSTF